MNKLGIGIATLLLLASTSLAQAQAQLKTLSPLKLPSTTQILQTIVDDVAAAIADAHEHQDPIAEACYQAIQTVAKARLSTEGVTGGKLIYAFQKVRDVTRINQSPMGTSLILGCAPLVQDAQVNMVTFFNNIGASVLLKGLLVP